MIFILKYMQLLNLSFLKVTRLFHKKNVIFYLFFILLLKNLGEESNIFQRRKKFKISTNPAIFLVLFL
jgi:hypothetical protein